MFYSVVQGQVQEVKTLESKKGLKYSYMIVSCSCTSGTINRLIPIKVLCFGPQSNKAQNLSKGDSILVAGSLMQFLNSKDKNRMDKMQEMIANELKILSNSSEKSSKDDYDDIDISSFLNEE